VSKKNPLWVGSVCCLVPLFPLALNAADLNIRAIRLSGGQLHLTASAKGDCYYVLRRAETANGTTFPVAMAAGSAADVHLIDGQAPAEGAFYLVREVSLDHPLDMDADGIDDVFELLHPACLDPTDLADALVRSPNTGFTGS
jgi:hypothetical protein